MKLCTAVQEGCGYKDTLSAHRYFAPLAKYFTVCITYQPPLVELARLRILSCDIKSKCENQTKKIVQRTEVQDEEFKQIATDRVYITDIEHITKS